MVCHFIYDHLGYEICGDTLLKTKSKLIEIDSVGEILFERSNRLPFLMEYHLIKPSSLLNPRATG